MQISVISCDHPCKDGNTRFTTVPLKTLSDQVWIRCKYFLFSKFYLQKWLAHLYCKKTLKNYRNFEPKKNIIGQIKDAGSLEITLTVPLIDTYSKIQK